MAMSAWIRLMTPLFETPGTNTGGGSAAGNAGGTGQTGAAAGAAGSTTASPNSGAAGTAAATSTAQPGAGQQQTPPGFTYKEDRSNWVPKHRFDEVNSRAQKSRELEAAIQERDRKIAALAGVTPADPNASKTEQVKEAIFQMFPSLRKLGTLNDEQIEKLLQAPEQAARASEVEQREWRRHGVAQLSVVFDKVAAAYQTDALSDRQKTRLTNDFKQWFSAKCQSETDATGSSATFQRYSQGDPALLDEFVKEFSSDFVEPARRIATTQNLTRTRPVPNSQGRAQVTQTQRPENFKSLDDRLDYAAGVLKEQGAFSR